MSDKIHAIYQHPQTQEMEYMSVNSDWKDSLKKHLISIFKTPEGLQEAIKHEKIVIIYGGNLMKVNIKETEIISDLELE